MPVFRESPYELQRKYKEEVEQLRVHAQVKRQPVSVTIKDMIDYCQSNLQDDVLINPVKENPFKEKKSCIIL